MDESKIDSGLLPLRPKPHVGELLHAYLVRVSEAYGYASPRPFCRAITRRYGAQPANVLTALGLSATDTQRLQGPAPSYLALRANLPRGLSADDFCRDVMRWCPDCVRSAPYIRAAWCIKDFCACIEHRTELLDHCPRCGRTQKLQRATILRCECGFVLSRSQARLARPEVLGIQDELANALRGCRAATFPRLALSDWLRLLRFVATTASSKKTGCLAGLQRVQTATALSLRAAALLHDWPNGFHQMLDRKRETMKQSFSLQKTFGRLYRWLYVDLNTPPFRFLRDAFEEYLTLRWQGPICGRNRRVQARVGRRYTSIDRLAKDADASPGIVKQLCACNRLDAAKVTHPSGRTSWSISEAEAPTVATLMRDGINLREAAAYLGLPRRRMRELLDTGTVLPVIRAGRALAPVWVLSKAQLDTLIQECAARALPKFSADSDSVVTIGTILRAWRLSVGEFPALLQAVRHDEIRCFASAPDDFCLGRLIFDRVSARRWHMQWQSKRSARISIDAAARLLGVKQEVAYHLVKVKALGSDMLQSGRSFTRIPIAAIETFRKTYVSLAQVARNRKTSSRAALASINVRPAMGPTIDGCRQYFFLRSDLAYATEHRACSAGV